MFPGGQKRERESDKDCLRREIKEELPGLKLGADQAMEKGQRHEPSFGQEDERRNLYREEISGDLTIGDKHEIDKATWRKPRGTRLTPTSRHIRDMLFPKR